MNPQPLWYKACALPMCYNCCAATFNNKHRYQLSTTTSPITAKQSLLLLIYSLFNFPHQIFRLRSAGVVFVSRPSFAFNLKREFLLSDSLSLSLSLSLYISLSPRHTLFQIKKSLEQLKFKKVHQPPNEDNNGSGNTRCDVWVGEKERMKMEDSN